MIRIFLVLFGLLVSAPSFGKGYATKLRVRLFSNSVLSKAQVTSKSGDYYLIALNSNRQVMDTLVDIHPQQVQRLVTATVTTEGVSLSLSGEDLGAYPGVAMVSSDTLAHWIVKGSGKERVYTGNLEFWPFGTQLHLINTVYLEEYIGGVVESEGGHVDYEEYLAAQAVLARTWVLKNLDKHSSEGYNVKDDQSSQAYYSMAYLQNSQAILSAVRRTRDSVLVNGSYELILSAFHSNSGGQTANSEDAWSQEVSYLRSVPDSFSMGGDKTYWTVNLPKARVHQFVSRYFGVKDSDPALHTAISQFKQDSRKATFSFSGRTMPLKHWRTQFALRSTFFSVESIENEYIFHGRGFGHGVGLSQEGAMIMAQRGFPYKEIISFYYRDVILTHKDQVK